MIDLVANFDRQMENLELKICRAMDAVMILIVNWIKNNHAALGGWKDHTYNLNNSITFSPAIATPDGTIRGTVYAGKEYAIYVEYKEGHWVLSGGMNEYRDKFMKLIVNYVKGQV